MTEGWQTLDEIAARWVNMPTQIVTAIADLLGLQLGGLHVRGNDAGTTEYSPAAVGLIERELLSRGYKREADDG